MDSRAPAHHPSTVEQVLLARFVRRTRALTPHTWVTPSIVAVNAAVFAAMVVMGVSPMTPAIPDLLAWGANYRPATTSGEWWRLGTSMFVHIGIIHILFNMYVLWAAGRFLERLVGNTGFGLLYVFSGLCGSLASLAWNDTTVSAGASGAVFGVYGALLGFLLRSRGTIPRPALRQLTRGTIAFVGYNLVFGLIIPNIDNAAHVGGLVAGFACGLVLAQRLDGEARRRRTRRNALVLVLGAATVVGGAYALPQYDDVMGALAELDEVEARTREVMEASQREALDDAAFAAVLDEQVLPPWRGLAASLRALERVPASQEELVSKVRAHVDARVAWWDVIVRAVAVGDGSLDAEIAARQRDSKRAVAALDDFMMELRGE